MTARHKHLHILNGDATTRSFKKSAIPGDRLVWREVLAEGPVTPDPESEDFWDQRMEFIREAYGGKSIDFHEKVISVFLKLREFNVYDEITLWFEHDLICQVNMLFLLQWMSVYRHPDTVISLVNIDSFPGVDPFHGLAQLHPDQLASLFPDRKPVSDDTLDIAGQLWEAYAGHDPNALVPWTRQEIPGLPFMRHAMSLHLSKFPNTTNGLNAIQTYILSELQLESCNFKQLYAGFMDKHGDYGFGDSQLKYYIQGLKPTYIKGSHKITDRGQRLLSGEADWLKETDRSYAIGGVTIHPENPWRWDTRKFSQG